MLCGCCKCDTIRVCDLCLCEGGPKMTTSAHKATQEGSGVGEEWNVEVKGQVKGNQPWEGGGFDVISAWWILTTFLDMIHTSWVNENLHLCYCWYRFNGCSWAYSRLRDKMSPYPKKALTCWNSSMGYSRHHLGVIAFLHMGLVRTGLFDSRFHLLRFWVFL